mgnify:CR=1 FL=1
MDFFGQQDDALRRSRLLTVLVIVAVVVVVGTLVGLTAWGMDAAVDRRGRPVFDASDRPGILLLVAGTALAVIVISAWIGRASCRERV